MKVICISGKAQHGKDSVAQEIKRQLIERYGGSISVLITHYADLVKYVCSKFFDWDRLKDEKGRTLLQHVGTDIVRDREPNYWVDFVSDILGFFADEWDYVLIPDCRFPNECDKMKREFDTVTVRVIRDNFENSLTEEQRNHPSETSLDTYSFDSYINNPGTKEGLEVAVSNWIKETLYAGN